MFALAAIVLIAGAASAGAQQYPLRLPAGTSAQPQRATKAKPKVEEPDPNYPANPLFTPLPIGVVYIPAILMADGTVWANFGHGYVQVRNACARPGRVIDGRGNRSPRRDPRDQGDSYCYTRTSQGSLVVTQ